MEKSSVEIKSVEIKLVPLSEIKLNPKNRNKHPDEQIDAIVKILRYQGFRRPGTISNRTGFLNCGEGRYLAAKRLKMTHMPVMFQDYDDEIQEYTDGIADNALDKQAILDYQGINMDIGELGPFDIDLLGIKDFAIDVADKELDGDPDEIPEVVEPIAKLGNIFKLGEHRVMCGDSTDEAIVKQLLAGEEPDMVFTDPPYNIDYQDMNGEFEKIKNDKMTDEQFLEFLKASIRPSNVMYVCCSWQFAHIFKQAMIDLGKPPKAMIVWDKVNPAQHLDIYFKQHEIIYYFGPFGGQKTVRGDVWQLKRQRNTVHPTMKPIELIEMALNDHPKLRSVFDSFGGSGSTLIACEKTNRKCFMMELDPHYVDVIIARFEKLTGKKAELLNE